MRAAASAASDLPESDRLGEWPHPRESRRLFGHAEAEHCLIQAANGRLPHAWIFGGPKGVGKATLAYRFAKALLAQGGNHHSLDTLDTDPAQPAIRRILSGGHPDLLTIRRPADPKTGKLKTEIPVDEVRRLGDFFSRHAGEGGYRIAIVDAADDLNRNAANALLKTLEEPPPRGLLILIAHTPRALLPTIRSRSRVLTFKPLQPDLLTEALAAITPDQPDREALAALSNGSIGAALEMAEYDAPGLDRTLTAIARKRGRDATASHTLANDLAAAAAAPRFRLFIERLQASFAAAAAAGDRAALDSWRLTADLARAEDNLNIDKRAIVLRLLERYAAI
jgi:DNA polymerase-3 subunit delta'